MTARLALAALLTAAALAACGERPPPRLTIDTERSPMAVDTIPDAEAEAQVLRVLTPIAIASVQRTWGTPGGDSAWALIVGPPEYPQHDSTGKRWHSQWASAPLRDAGPREHARHEMHAGISRALRPAPEGHLVQDWRYVLPRLHLRGDTIFASLSIGAGRICYPLRDSLGIEFWDGNDEPVIGESNIAHAFDFVFLRGAHGAWSLASELARPPRLDTWVSNGWGEQCRPRERDRTLRTARRMPDIHEHRRQYPQSPFSNRIKDTVPPAAVEAAILPQLAREIPGVMREVWGVPPRSTRWPLWSSIEMYGPMGRMGTAGPWYSQTSAATSPRHAIRARWHARLERALGATPSVGRNAVVLDRIPEWRSVRVDMRIRRGDSVIVYVELTAGRSCGRPGQITERATAYGRIFLRDAGGRWHPDSATGRVSRWLSTDEEDGRKNGCPLPMRSRPLRSRS